MPVFFLGGWVQDKLAHTFFREFSGDVGNVKLSIAWVIILQVIYEWGDLQWMVRIVP